MREDGAEWWSGSETYVSRIAALLKRPGKLFDGLPFGGDDLLQRLGRVQELGLCASEAQQQADYLRHTQTVEMADLLRMTDVAAMVLEGRMNLPTLPQGERAALRDVAELALESWRERQDRLRTAQREQDRRAEDYEEKIQALERRAAKAEAELARLRGATPAAPPAPMPEARLTARAAAPSRRNGRAQAVAARGTAARAARICSAARSRHELPARETAKHEIRGLGTGQGMGADAAEQLVEHGTEQVDVASGREGATEHLLRAGVPGRADLEASAGHDAARCAGPEQLGDAEVEELGGPIVWDQGVARLEVAVDYQVLVRVLHGGANVHAAPTEGPKR